ncbi:ABC transporter permease subunit [Saccharibacter sp. 17.LH.SD]|uniref:ABC transporter permease n=1 Tax=Saccharibacter sp. 17.LH.SD TaxID=2689393 RepID=UPI00136C8E5D|nr:ABC transporter permease [Saccharibacter sp. 17.LH.SD]MXV44692.1 ABC transporter permease subunit [Saccharibacter sp. 17.LH.SD]
MTTSHAGFVETPPPAPSQTTQKKCLVLSLPHLAYPPPLKGATGIAAVALLWEILPRTGVVDPLFVPPLSSVLHALFQEAQSGQLLTHASASIERVIPGLLLAIIGAIPAGLFFGSSKTLRQFLSPLIEIFRNTSALALLPVFTLLLGIGEASKITMVFYAAAWPIFLSTINGLNGVDPVLIKAGRSLGLTKTGLFLHIILPAAVPSIFTGIRLASAASLLVLVAAEMVGSRAGLGYLVNASQLDFDIPQMYAGILTLSIIGGLTNLLLLRVERRLLSWQHA